MSEALASPRKTRELQNHHMDSTIWNEFPFRDDDIVIATYAKAGTTWMQQIVGSLVFQDATPREFPKVSPWIDQRFAGSGDHRAARQYLVLQHPAGISFDLQPDEVLVLWKFINFYRESLNDAQHKTDPQLKAINTEELFDHNKRWREK